MRDLSALDPLVDDIAAQIDRALADPARAHIVRATLRDRLSRAQTAALAEEEEADGDDLWDNVPL